MLYLGGSRGSPWGPPGDPHPLPPDHGRGQISKKQGFTAVVVPIHVLVRVLSLLGLGVGGKIKFEVYATRGILRGTPRGIPRGNPLGD